MFSIEDRIWDGQRMSVSATVGRTPGAGLGVLRWVRTLKAASLQRHFWARNAPYAVKDRDNPLKSQQMRARSERTTGSKPLIQRIFRDFSTSTLLPVVLLRVIVPVDLTRLGAGRSSHHYLNQRPAKTITSSREGSGVVQRRSRDLVLSFLYFRRTPVETRRRARLNRASRR